MKKRNGFTLVELLGVVIILGIIALIATPPVINQIKKSNSKVNEANIRLLYSHGETYIREHNNSYSFSNGSNICVSLQTLIDAGEIDEKELMTEGLTKSKYLIYTVNSKGNLEYDIKVYNSCSK